MKTKYILHGGYTKEENELNNSYFAEMVNDVPAGGTILLVYFASDDEGVDEKFLQDVERMDQYAGEKKINFKKASKENFIAEVEAADVIYIRGGDTQKLLETLKGYPDFTEVIKGKTVSGSSAGAYVLSSYYFTNSLSEVREGLGCVPARTVCHHESERHAAAEGVDPVAEMGKVDTSLELILLKDYEWVVQEIEKW